MSQDFRPVADAIRAGNKFEAIRLLRELTGMSVDEAEKMVDRLEAEDPSLTAAREGGLPGSEVSAAAAAKADEDFSTSLKQDLDALRAPRNVNVAPLEGELADQVAVLAAAHRYLDAIKLVQARTGADLKTAKDQVEALMEQRGIARRNSKGCFVVVLAILLAMLGLALALMVQ
jgi:ribosomal protein L7/L12